MVEQLGDPNKKRRNIIIALGAFLVLLGLFLIFGFNIAGSTRPIKEVADKFNPGSTWKFESESVRPPRFFCLDGGSCPQLYRHWTSPYFNLSELESSIRDTGWNYKSDTSCSITDTPRKEEDSICWIDAYNEKYSMDLYVVAKENNTVELTLYIMPQ